MKLCFIFYFYLVHIFSKLSIKANLSDTMERCCNIGKSSYISNRECPDHTLPLIGIHHQDRHICRSMIELCCQSSRTEENCHIGLQHARSHHNCDDFSDRGCQEVAKRCCNCCYMGIQVQKFRISCHTVQLMLSGECEKHYTECCNENSTSFTQTHQSSVSVSITHANENDQNDMCLRFPGRLCAHECINTPGSYECKCNDGYTLLSDQRSCAPNVVTNPCNTESNCEHECTFDRITNLVQCKCYTGYNLQQDQRSCRDIDECRMNYNQCGTNDQCINTIGSFYCQLEEHRTEVTEVRDESISNYPYMGSCGIGFVFSQLNQLCEDINECALNQDTCIEGQACENTIGSFYCRRSIGCGTGYTLDQSTQQCLDDNECQLGTHNCGPSRDCNNIPGSFRCVQKGCPFGYKLDSRSGTCDPVICSRGMKPDIVGNCIDLNECVERPELCKSTQECRNTIGSYSCQDLITCGIGFELNENGHRCDDIDECNTGNNDCLGHLMQCINQPGTYICQCPSGFQVNQESKHCDDIDECRLNHNICAQNARCENTHGSYRCICKEGFEFDGNVCQDFDECARPGMCQQICRNTWGSFQCGCEEGYKVAEDTRMCDDIDECQVAAENGLFLCFGICENIHGSFMCTCPFGYQLSNDQRTCIDIDECAMRTHQCTRPDELCINTRGGYKCQLITCPRGFTKAPVLDNRSSNIKCQKKTFLCPQGDVECQHAPLSYSNTFITFSTNIQVPADLFTMKGPVSPYRRLTFNLKVIKAEDPNTGVSRVNREFFSLQNTEENSAVIKLLHQIDGPQDIELELDMVIYSKEFRQHSEEVYFGTAIARIFIFVTKDEWLIGT